MTPDVTVVVPTHNRPHLLRLTLRTILAQRGATVEVIVVDDGSTDDTAERVGAIGDPRVRLLRHERPYGVSTARNRGASGAAGTWLAFCDDDDLWAPDKLARQLDAARALGRRWCYAGAVRVDGALGIKGPSRPPAPEHLVARLPRWTTMPGGASNVVVRRDLFEEAGGWDPELVNLADWDLWIRLARREMPACVSEPLVGYRLHPGNASRDTALILREARVIDARYGGGVDYGELHLYLAWIHLRSGQQREGLTHLAHALGRGQIRAVVRALHALGAPRARRLLRLPAPGIPASDRDWNAAAESWLAPLRGA